jgi:uncharacterized protein
VPLSPEAGRVLGCLVEKQLTTPQQYPLTLHALTAAAGQATNRDPVVALTEDDVLAAIDELRGGHLVRVVLPSHGRSVNRYRHVLDEVYGLDAARSGLLAGLLLRGPQTVGELRTRTERMVDLPSVADVQAELDVLAEHADDLVRLVPRRPGQKEDRWQQTLAAPWGPAAGPGRDVEVPDGPAVSAASGVDRPPHPPPTPLPHDPDRPDGLGALHAEVAALREAVSALREELADLRRGLGG